MIYLEAFVAAILLLTIGTGYALDGPCVYYHKDITHSLSSKSVETAIWRQDVAIPTEISELRYPLLFQGAVPSDWMQDLRHPNKLETAVPHLRHVFTSKDRNFVYYDTSKPLVNATGVQIYPKHFVIPQMTTGDFIKSLQTENLGDDVEYHYYYYSGLFQLPVNGLSRFTVQESFPQHLRSSSDPEGKDKGRHQETNLWIGAARVVTNAHYDAYHNCFIQLHGHKRFLLLHPSQWWNMYVYPSLHPSDRQSQVNLDGSNFTHFPDFNPTSVLEAYLEEGDVLYVPPFWFHHVEAINISISLNVWSDSWEYRWINRLFKNAIPFYEKSWPKDKLIFVTQHFLKRLVPRILGVPSNFVYNFLKRQYSRILDVDEDLFICSQSTGKGIDQFLAPHLQQISSVFNSLPLNSRLILLANYLESAANIAVGVDNVVGFLKDCVS